MSQTQSQQLLAQVGKETFHKTGKKEAKASSKTPNHMNTPYDPTEANYTDMVARIQSPGYYPKQVHEIELKRIVPNKYNRKHNEEELLELAESIKQFGVLCAIQLRPIENNMFEIVYGEGRYHASLLADKETIPAYVNEIDDKIAYEMTITENLKRKDYEPLELAANFQRLIEQGYDVKSLSIRFGKSETFIAGRLKLNDLIPEIKELLENEEINVTTALVLAKFDQQIQEKCYFQHLKTNDPYSWRAVKPQELTRRIMKSYLCNLNDYQFDKGACMTCAHNTQNQKLLFGDENEQPSCQNRACMEKKNVEFLLQKCKALAAEDPRIHLAENSVGSNKVAVKILKGSYCVGWYTNWDKNNYQIPVAPEGPAPDPKEYDDYNEYLSDKADYDAEMVNYEESMKALEDQISEGTLKKIAVVGERDVVIRYQINPKPVEQIVDPLEELRKQDKEDLEATGRKIMQDIEKLFEKKKPSFTELKDSDWKLLFYILLNRLESDWYSELKYKGVDGDSRLTPEIRKDMIRNLTPRRQSVLVKSFILGYFFNRSTLGITPQSPDLQLFCQFAQDNFGEVAQVAVAQHLDAFQKKHEVTQAKIDALVAAQKEKEALEGASDMAALPEHDEQVQDVDYTEVIDDVEMVDCPVEEAGVLDEEPSTEYDDPVDVEWTAPELPPIEELLPGERNTAQLELMKGIYVEVEAQRLLPPASLETEKETLSAGMEKEPQTVTDEDSNAADAALSRQTEPVKKGKRQGKRSHNKAA